jgi:hypothetical protein
MTNHTDRFYADMTDSLMLDQQDHEAEIDLGMREEWGDPEDPRWGDLLWDEITTQLEEIERERWEVENERDMMFY